MLENKTTSELNEKIEGYVKSYFGETTISNYEELIEKTSVAKRNIYLGAIDGDTGSIIETAIRFYNQIDNELNIPVDERTPIKLFIDSPGGCVESALTICDALKMSATPVWTINQGKAHSGGALVFLCGHERYTYESATFLLHEGATRLGGYMDKSKFMDYAKFYDSLVLVMKDKILANTNITEEEYELHKKDDWWFDAKEALELKVADKIVTPDIYKTF